ncbi:hypothetical protein HDV02_005282 [Globomyces sp. JEL0801]|nr:hypothetical protein HDV02_005282 [Globomyces sp. JEL0801]
MLQDQLFNRKLYKKINHNTTSLDSDDDQVNHLTETSSEDTQKTVFEPFKDAESCFCKTPHLDHIISKDVFNIPIDSLIFNLFDEAGEELMLGVLEETGISDLHTSPWEFINQLTKQRLVSYTTMAKRKPLFGTGKIHNIQTQNLTTTLDGYIYDVIIVPTSKNYEVRHKMCISPFGVGTLIKSTVSVNVTASKKPTKKTTQVLSEFIGFYASLQYRLNEMAKVNSVTDAHPTSNVQGPRKLDGEDVAQILFQTKTNDKTNLYGTMKRSLVHPTVQSKLMQKEPTSTTLYSQNLKEPKAKLYGPQSIFNNPVYSTQIQLQQPTVNYIQCSTSPGSKPIYSTKIRVKNQAGEPPELPKRNETPLSFQAKYTKSPVTDSSDDYLQKPELPLRKSTRKMKAYMFDDQPSSTRSRSQSADLDYTKKQNLNSVKGKARSIDFEMPPTSTYSISDFYQLPKAVQVEDDNRTSVDPALPGIFCTLARECGCIKCKSDLLVPKMRTQVYFVLYSLEIIVFLFGMSSLLQFIGSNK